MEKWEKMIETATILKSDSEKLLSKAAQLLMHEKGFSEQAVELFDADFATGNETIIKFNGCGEFCDLDISIASSMTKEEIIERLSRELTEEDIELLKS